MFGPIKIKITALIAAGVLATATAGGLAVAGCGGDNPPATTTDAAAASGAIPDSLRTVESGAEDTTDFVLAGERAQAVDAANALNEAAQGQAAKDLATAGISAARIDELKARAAEVARIAPGGKPIDVALAANRAFELVPGFFAVYSDPVPAEVIELDYLDFEAKLQGIAGDSTEAASAIAQLDRTWSALRGEVVAAGGDSAAAQFDAHVAEMLRLTSAGTDQQIADEAQHGLDLVDEIEVVYAG